MWNKPRIGRPFPFQPNETETQQMPYARLDTHYARYGEDQELLCLGRVEPERYETLEECSDACRQWEVDALPEEATGIPNPAEWRFQSIEFE